MDFRESPYFKKGRSGEQLVAGLLQEQKWWVVPSYDYAGDDGNKAPRLQGLNSGYVLPDLDVSREGRRMWVEVKTKAEATFHRLTGQWEHGLPLRHWNDYQRVQVITGCEVWLFIFEEKRNDILFNSVDVLRNHARRYIGNKMSYGGMVFFPVHSFRSWAQTFGEGAA